MSSSLSDLLGTLGALPYPLSGQALEQEFIRLERQLPRALSQGEALEYCQALETARRVNFTFIASLLRDSAAAILRKIVRRWHLPLDFAEIVDGRVKLELKLLRKASDFVELTVQDAPKLNVYAIARQEVRCYVSELLLDSESLCLLTPDAITRIYESCRHLLAGKTQVQILALRCRDELRPYIEAHFDQLLDPLAFPPFFERKLLRRLVKTHFQRLTEVVRRTFYAELSACVSGQLLDWDLDPQSEKGEHMLFVASTAQSLQPAAAFAQSAMSGLIDWSRYSTAQELAIAWQPLLECVCRLYAGLLDLSRCARQEDINSNPEVYLWMRRVLQKLYNYPHETYFFENRFLNIASECVAAFLKSNSAFRQNLRYTLQPQQIVPNSLHDPSFLESIYDSVEFRYLSPSPSLITMLHVSGATSDSTLDQWPLVTGLDVNKTVLQWRGSCDSASQDIAAFLAVPLTMLSGWLTALPLLVSTASGASLHYSDSLGKTLRKATSIGVFLGLLLVHRQITNRFLSLCGFCFGAQIVMACLAEVAEFNRRSLESKRVYVADVVLFLAAVDAEEVDWELVTEAVRGRFINLFSSRQACFPSLFAAKMRKPLCVCGAGRSGVEDVDVSDILAEELSLFESKKQAPSAFKRIAKLISYYP